jgi:hypothetical protein
LDVVLSIILVIVIVMNASVVNVILFVGVVVLCVVGLNVVTPQK